MKFILLKPFSGLFKDRRQGVQDLFIYDNVKNMEQYRELMGNLKSLDHVEQELKGLLEKQERSND
jgi:hypothetical protein